MSNTGPPPSGPPPGAPPMGPPLKFQPGERENYNRGSEIIGVSCTLGALAFAVVCLRIWVRIRFIRQLAVEDYLMAISAVMLLVLALITIPTVNRGAGRHIEYIPPDDLAAALHLNFATQPSSLIALGMAKLSVGTFLLRVSPSRFYTWFIWALLGVTVISTCAGTLQLMLQCRPMEFIWNKALPGGGQCIPGDIIVAAAYAGFAIGIGTDFIFAVLPIPMLWNVQLNWRVKLAIMGILSLGLFTTAAAIVKSMFITSLGKEGDFMWDSVDITIWYNAEISVAIIAGSIPSLKPLFKKILESTSARRYAYGSKYGVSSRSKGGNGGTMGASRASKLSRTTQSATRNSNMPPPRASKHTSMFAHYGAADIDLDDVNSDKLGSVFEMSPSPGSKQAPKFESHVIACPPPAAAPGVLRRNLNPNPSSPTSTGPVLDGDACSSTGIGMALGGEGAHSARSSSESSGIIIQRPDDYLTPPGRITRTLEISVAVEDVYQKSVKDMV
ncbi:hypothetical protein MAPG_04457 [Magnaporthiopsis poae ATCC 64411]|uniref:Rhodopsin domain-containing protein n=1 Tax=Magnaporthiopsis poae (strain ATCC 64411 / 73-15) TaxID=644358 RepID=A0A0C4DWS7_MAGP6|nr:hypothetical protein MAPG_04457 [Magnaporthiopsis poae ATCC 64411]